MNTKRILLASLSLIAYASPLICMQLSDSELSDRLCRAIWNNQPQEALKALIAGANPNKFEIECPTKLYGGSGSGVLLETPLIAAAQRGRTQICEQLIKRGAKTKEKDSKGWTPLLWAAQSGQVDVCHVLLAHGSSIDEEEKNKHNNPLDIAAFEGHAAIVKLLLTDYGVKLCLAQKTKLKAALASGQDADALIATMHSEIKGQLRPLLKHAQSLASIEMLQLLLNPDDFSNNFGPDIETEIRKQLGLIKPPAPVATAPADEHPNRSSDETKKCIMQ